jgi:hypothetical protein
MSIGPQSGFSIIFLTIAEAVPGKIYGEIGFDGRPQYVRRAVIRPIDSLIAVNSSRRNGEDGEHYAR